MDSYLELMSKGKICASHIVTNGCLRNRPHFHLGNEILFNRSDGLNTMINGKRYHVEKGSLLLFNNMDLHYNYMLSDLPYDRYVVFFEPEYIQHFSSVHTNLLECFFYRPQECSHILKLSEEQQVQIQKTMDELVGLCESNSKQLYGRELKIKLKLAELLIDVNQFYREKSGIRFDSGYTDYTNIYEIMNYIHMNLEKEISLQYLSNKYCINRNKLCMLFRKVTGVSVMDYIIKCRISLAKELLIHGTDVATVCDRCGFNNYSHFSRTFKEKTGYSPKKYQMMSQTTEIME